MTMKNRFPAAGAMLFVMVCLSLSACTSAYKPVKASSSEGVTTDRTSRTLFSELGGHEGIQALSHQFIKEIAANKRVRSRFAKTDIGRFDRMFQEHICSLAGGPCTYTGDTMQKTHGGMNIQPSEFNEMVANLIRAMEARQLPVTTQNRLLAILSPMRSDVIRH